MIKLNNVQKVLQTKSMFFVPLKFKKGIYIEFYMYIEWVESEWNICKMLFSGYF